MILVSIVLFSGCDIAYFFHFASDYSQLGKESVPINEVLYDDRIASKQKKRLRFVAKIKAFGETELGLKKTDNYQKVYLKSDRPLVYVVSAAKKDRLERMTWWFPVVKKTPNLIYFDLSRAISKKNKLSQIDLDVSLIAADAYNSLGWFEDPVTLNLIESSIPNLVETILHEMTHSTIFVERQMEFNEGLANFVGKIGAVLFLESTFGSSHHFTADAKNAFDDQRLFSNYMISLLNRLEGLYESPISYREKMAERERVFAGALELFEWHKERLKTDRFIDFGQTGLNNSYLLFIALYHRHFDLFEHIYNEKGQSIPRMIEFFEIISQQEGDMLIMAGERIGRLYKGQQEIMAY